MYDPKLPVVDRKETVAINEDEQDEEDAPVPAWLSRLRDRRKRDLEARTAGAAGKDSKGGPARSQGARRAGRQGMQEQGPREIQSLGQERRQEGQHERNRQEKWQVRINLESEGSLLSLPRGEESQTSRRCS